MKKKIYVSIMGGIGDQIFQYAFANFLKKKMKDEVCLDISYYNNISNYNNFKFRLENLSKRNKLLIKKNIFKLNFKYLSYLRIFNIFKIDIIIPSIYKFFFNTNIDNFIYEYWKKEKIFEIKKNSYYFGYWHNLKYLKPLKKNINKNLISINIDKSKIKRFIKNRINNKTVCIHIRGGDFKNLSSHNLLEQKYYDDSILFYEKKLVNPIFHVFTNDIRFSKSILKKHSSVFKFKFIKEQKLTDIEEFCLFSKYKFSIIANSTFSLISSFLSLNRNLNIAPKVWVKGKSLNKNKRFSKLKFI
jgi:hypothetical protein